MDDSRRKPGPLAPPPHLMTRSSQNELDSAGLVLLTIKWHVLTSGDKFWPIRSNISNLAYTLGVFTCRSVLRVSLHAGNLKVVSAAPAQLCVPDPEVGDVLEGL